MHLKPSVDFLFARDGAADGLGNVLCLVVVEDLLHRAVPLSCDEVVHGNPFEDLCKVDQQLADYNRKN